MKVHRKLICFILSWGIFHSLLFAQVDENSMDMRLIKTLEEVIQPDAQLRGQLDSIVRLAASNIVFQEEEKRRVQRELNDENMVMTEIKVKNQIIKDIREERDLEIQSLLNPEQLAIYNEKVKPQKPQVLHFGMHNRADCNVCKQ